jgi:multimeric flavodoxin WrbA
MKIIGIIASPQKKGNTAWIINKILESTKEHYAETQSWYFSDLDIKPCRGCWCCKKGDMGCVVDDDMQGLYEAIAHADVIVLGSPVYMGQMSAQAKIFTDRLFACSSPRFSPYFKENDIKKKMILVFTQGNPDSGKFQLYFNYTRDMFQMLEFDVKGVHVVAGLRNESADERKELPAVIKDIGSSLFSE